MMARLLQPLIRRLSPHRTRRGRWQIAIALCLLAAATASAQQSSSTPAPQPSGQNSANAASNSSDTITGQIITDDGRSAAKAILSVFPVERRGPGAPSPAVTLDEKGSFRISGLAPGLYNISATLRGYLRVFEPSSGTQPIGTYRPGDVVTIKMAKGGIITGRVTNSKGEPVIGVKVQVLLVGTNQDGSVRDGNVSYGDRQTDDRGVYRIYGLWPGTYVVRAGGMGSTSSSPVPFDRYVTDYYPSGPRSEAATVTVRYGEEARDVDISFRGQHGYQVSGAITGAIQAQSPYSSIGIRIVETTSGDVAATTSLRARDSNNQFTLYGVPDGEYWLSADKTGNNPYLDYGASPPRRVTIKGADVSGIELPLTPLSSIAGRAVLEAAKEPTSCAPARSSPFETASLNVRRDQPSAREGLPLFTYSTSGARFQTNGEFEIVRIEAGHYYFTPLLRNENWFVRAITQAVAPPAKGSRDAGREGVMLKSGERVEGLTVTLAEGAAGVRGRIVADKEGVSLPARLRVYLIPAEPAAANDLLRYAQVNAGSDGSFSFASLAPGRYWLIARSITNDKMNDALTRPLAWDSGERAKLRREAEAAKVEIELQPCQRLNDYALRYAPGK